MHLYTDEGNIDTTANHPFYVIGKGWVAAGDLAEGDEVYNLDGTTSTILGSEIEILDESVLVYNLEVEDLHSYFVGCVPVLVHNYEKGEPLNDGDLVVRGGVSAPQNLQNNQANELPGRGSLSANGGMESLKTLAGYGTTGSGFNNNQVSYTTAGDIRNLGSGWKVVHDPTIGDDGRIINPYHTAIIPPNGDKLTPEQASRLSNLFNCTPNTFNKK